MLDVASLQQFDFFSNFTLYAGSSGLYRTISNVVVLDYEGLGEDFCDFHEGDFVITNLLYAREHPDKIYSSFSKLIDIGVSAIAIKTIFFQELPQSVIDLADEREVPILFFSSIYIEDVILNITDYLRSSTNYNYYESLIDSVLHKSEDTTSLNELMSDIVSEQYQQLSCMYISYKGSIDNFSMQRNLNKMQLHKNNLSYSNDIFFFKYKKGILFLYLYKDSFSSIIIRQNWEKLLLDLSIEKHRFFIGISDQLLPSRKINIAIQRSLYANQSAISKGNEIVLYNELYLDNLILPLTENSYVREYLGDLLHLLKGHPSSQTSNLSETLNAYVACNYRIDKTAQMLYQHPNTIRYRINKIKSMIGIPNDIEFQMIALLMVKIL